MEVRVSDQPSVTIIGSNYSVGVPVAFYDDAGWKLEGTTLTITGALTDTPANFMGKLTTASNTWQANVAIRETFEVKLAGIVGRIL